jgi:hypothetical protein
MNHHLGAWFKYNRQGAKCFKEANWLREESTQRMTQHEKNLEQKKEKIFKEKNVHKWELRDADLRLAQDVVNDRK